MAEKEADAPIPLVLLTGFLGAGKTTVLNRVLAAQDRYRVAVIVNELGRIDIDGKLLRARAGDVVELAGGCVCHEIRTQEELWGALDEVIPRGKPERIVLETTGIAEPQAILDGLEQRARGDVAPVVVSSVITVLDAQAGAQQLERFAEARAQVDVADGLLLSKLDVVNAPDLAALHRSLDALNKSVERATFPDTPEGSRELAHWLLDRPRRGAGKKPGRHHHAHAHGQLTAASFSDDGVFVGDALLALCERLGRALVRVKGFVNVHGEDRRGFLEHAGVATTLRLDQPWPPGPRRTELVFIGEGLDPGVLRRELWACRATT